MFLSSIYKHVLPKRTEMQNLTIFSRESYPVSRGKKRGHHSFTSPVPVPAHAFWAPSIFDAPPETRPLVISARRRPAFLADW